jgi:hypothetical protein
MHKFSRELHREGPLDRGIPHDRQGRFTGCPTCLDAAPDALERAAPPEGGSLGKKCRLGAPVPNCTVWRAANIHFGKAASARRATPSLEFSPLSSRLSQRIPDTFKNMKGGRLSIRQG